MYQRHRPACKPCRQKRSIANSRFGLRQLRSRLMLPSLALSKMDIGQSLSDWSAGMVHAVEPPRCEPSEPRTDPKRSVKSCD